MSDERLDRLAKAVRVFQDLSSVMQMEGVAEFAYELNALIVDYRAAVRRVAELEGKAGGR